MSTIAPPCRATELSSQKKKTESLGENGSKQKWLDKNLI